MKRFLMLALPAVLVTATLSAQQVASSGNHRKIEGSGNVITRDVPVTSFTGLEVSGTFNLVLAQGSQEGVKIETDDNLQELFDIKNDGDRLVISMEKNVNIKSVKKMKIYVTFKTLKDLELKTVGNVSSSGSLRFDKLALDIKSVGNIDLDISAKSLTIDSKSVGDVKLKGKADDVTVRSKGVGSFEAGNLVVQRMDIDNSSIGTAVVNAEKELKVKDTMLGKVTNKGAATARKINRQTI